MTSKVTRLYLIVKHKNVYSPQLGYMVQMHTNQKYICVASKKDFWKKTVNFLLSLT